VLDIVCYNAISGNRGFSRSARYEGGIDPRLFTSRATDNLPTKPGKKMVVRAKCLERTPQCRKSALRCALPTHSLPSHDVRVMRTPA
jgi:hypothetical protein